jgi:Clostripain family
MKTPAEAQSKTKVQLNVADWTVMIYFAVSSDLDNEAMADLKAIKRVGSTDEIKILAQLDSPRYGSAYRFLIQDERTMFEEDIRAELPEINNGDPKELSDFIRWGMREYPARHYLLVLWGHGRGWENLDDAHRPAALSSKRPFYFYIESDRQAERLPRLPEDVLMLDELSKALKSAVEYGDSDKIDIFGMDACLMGMAEVGYQIRESVRYLVASEDAIPKDGWPYDRIFTRLKERPGMTPEQLSVTIIREVLIHYREKNKDVTLSVCNLGQSGRLASALGICLS